MSIIVRVISVGDIATGFLFIDHLFYCCHYTDAFRALSIIRLAPHSVLQVLSLLLKHPVWECKTACLVPAICEIFEELSNDSGFRVATFVEDDVEEFGELNHARIVVIHHLDEVFDFLD